MPELIDATLLQRIAAAAAQQVLVMEPGNVTPTSRTPWGGTRIAERWPAQRVPNTALPHTIGEAWIVSTHPSFPSMTTVCVDGTAHRVALRDVCGELPFLLKLLNSASWTESIKQLQTLIAQLHPPTPVVLTGNYHAMHRQIVALLADTWPENARPVLEAIRTLHRHMLAANLSIQVHPHRGYAPDKPSKTEAWVILEAEAGAGIYMGLRDGVTREHFATVLAAAATAAQAGREDFLHADVSELLNFVPVQAGDVFFIPSGTIHAIGAGIVLLEPQETSETTFRVFDWYRRPARDLHIDDTMAVTRWNDPRGTAAVAQLRCTPVPGATAGEEILVQRPEFTLRRWSGTEDLVSKRAVTGVQAIFVEQGRLTMERAVTSEPASVSAGSAAVLPPGLAWSGVELSDNYTLYVIDISVSN